jgi:hypothetical protein
MLCYVPITLMQRGLVLHVGSFSHGKQAMGIDRSSDVVVVQISRSELHSLVCDKEQCSVYQVEAMLSALFHGSVLGIVGLPKSLRRLGGLTRLCDKSRQLVSQAVLDVWQFFRPWRLRNQLRRLVG